MARSLPCQGPFRITLESANRVARCALALAVLTWIAMPWPVAAQAPAARPPAVQPPIVPAQAVAPGDAVTLNFVNADIEAVVRAVSEITGRNFIIDPRVKGAINIISARRLPRWCQPLNGWWGIRFPNLCAEDEMAIPPAW